MTISIFTIFCLIALFDAKKVHRKKKAKVDKPPPPEDLVIQTLDEGEECEVTTQEGNILHVFLISSLIFLTSLLFLNFYAI